MSYYTATISKDSYYKRADVVVHWDDNDPNRLITAPVVLPYEPTEQDLSKALGSSGWRVVSSTSDNVGRGWAIVTRITSERPFFNPIDRTFYSSLSPEQKRQIRRLYPTAQVPIGTMGKEA